MGVENKRPNILWICSDQQRFDTIHALGNDYVRTPVIDGLVEKGVAFQSAYAQSPICTPSRASFMTGRYCATHHQYKNGAESFPDQEILVSKLFADQGYFCGLIGKLHLSAAQGEVEKRPKNDGYHYFAWSQHPYPDVEDADYVQWLKNEKGIDPKPLYDKLEGSVGPGVDTEYHQTTWAAERAISVIREQRDTPWFLNINVFAPHPTFRPPEEYLERYDSSTLPYPVFREGDIEHQKKFRHLDQQTNDAVNPYEIEAKEDTDISALPIDQQASVPPSSYDPRYMKACYYAEIELIDTQVGRIIEALRETGQLDNTIVIYMSDHGEMLGDHGLLFKGCRFFDPLVHVPLIISWPERFRSGVRSKALVELIDLAPTLLEAVGQEVPYYMQGVSFLELLQGESDLDHHKGWVFSEYNETLPTAALYPDGRETDRTHSTMHFDGRYKVSIYHGHNLGEIYDLENDPDEFNDLWDEPGFQETKTRLLFDHMTAMANATGSGVRRTKDY